MDILIWVFIAVIFTIFELVTGTFILIWFAVGSVVAAVLNYLGFDIYVQFIAFAIVSLMLILSTRRFADRITPEPTKKTTAERLIGKHGKVIRKRDDNNYIVNVNGEEWSATGENNLDVDDEVKIIGIESIKLIVKKID
ncbi:NfeD family protein [Methanobrevibacter sp.]|uniref:NfeD family protein n=1 Tax=Methanobrevibacter sp. TaxID=66852 RepID=UPI003864B016